MRVVVNYGGDEVEVSGSGERGVTKLPREH